MAGFFDALTNLTPDQNQGLLALAASLLQSGGPSRTPTSIGQALGGSLQAFQQGVQSAQDRAYQQQLRALNLDEANMTAEERRRKNKIEQEIQSAALASVRSPEQLALATGGGPTIANAQAAQNLPGEFDQQGFIKRVRSVDPLRAMEFERQFAKAAPEFDTTPRVGVDEQGRPFSYVISKSGAVQRLPGVLPRDELKLLNLGGREVAYNPYALTAGQAFTRTADPNAILSASTARRGQDLSFQSSALDRAQRSQAEKAPTEFQGKSAAYGLRAEEADKILNNLQGKYSPAAINAKLSVQETPLIGGVLGAATNATLSSEDQQAEQAQRDFVNAILRQESGAAIGIQEFDNARRQYFPQPGDSTAVIQQKARNRQLAIQGLQSNAGRAKLSAPAAPSGWSITRVGD